MCRGLSEKYEVTLIAVHPREEIREGIRIVPFKRYHNRRFRILFSWLLMFFKAVKVKAKVYHLHDPELIPCGLLLKWIGKKVILDIHENIAEDLFDKPWIKNQKLTFRLFTLFETLACRNFYVILAENSYAKRYKNICKHWAVVLNYVDNDFFERFEKKTFKHQLNLFYIGIVLENRGILQILEAMHLLQREGYSPHFHCVGELYSDLSGKIKALPCYEALAPALHFHGRMDLDEGYEMAADMDIGLCIIWKMKNSEESYPTKIFEYMRVGLPVVTSDFKLYRETVEGNGAGICVDPMSPEEIKKAILTIHTDVEKSELMSKRGQKAAFEKYGWESQKAVLMRVYETLCQ